MVGFLALAATILVGEPGAAGQSMAQPFEVGQVWMYVSRPGEEGSTLTVLRVEQPEGRGEIVHIFVSGLHIKNARAPGGFSSEIRHLPMDADALRKSVTKLVRKAAELPDFEEGYRQWKQAKGGAFTVSVADAVGFVEKAISK